MANHCYLTSKTLPRNPDVIEADLKEVLERFPMLELTRTDKYFQISHHKPPNRDQVLFWITNNDLSITISRKGNRVYKTTPKWAMLEFRHGHSNPMYWWLEYEVRAMFTRKYDTYSLDEGIGEYKEDTRQFKNYHEYFTKVEQPTEIYGISQLQWLRELINMPENQALKPLVGLDKLPIARFKTGPEKVQMDVQWVDI